MVIGNDLDTIAAYLQRADEIPDFVTLTDTECLAMDVVIQATRNSIRPAVLRYCSGIFMDWPQHEMRDKIAACLLFHDVITPEAVRLGLLAPL